MRKYTYQARDSENKMTHGTAEAKHIRGVREDLAAEGLIAVEVLPVVSLALSKQVNAKELAIFCRQFALVLQSDITTLRGLAMMNEQIEDKRLKKTLDEVLSNMEHGETFADSMAEQYGHLPRYLINMVQVGETSGSLDIVMLQMASYYEKESRTLRKVRTATTYPVILTVMMVIVLGLLMVQVLPTFDRMLGSMGQALPDLTRVLINISRFLAQWILPILVVIVLIIVGLVMWSKTSAGRDFVGRMQISVPFLRRLYIRVFTSRLGRSLGLLLKSGVTLYTALQLMEQLLGNSFIEQKIAKISKEIEKGSTLYEELEKLNLFPPLMLRMVHVGEETGKLDEMLFSSATIFEEEVDEAIDRLTTMIEPTLIIILAIIVGFVLMSVMLPMTDIMSHIG